MPRPRNTIPRYVTVDTQEMSATIRNMTDSELGAWFRKAVIDLCSGCISHDVDPVVEKTYNHSLRRMNAKQNIDATTYQNRKSRQEAAARKDADLESFEKLDTSCTAFEDAANGNAAENAPRRDNTTAPVVSEPATSSSNLHGADHNTSTHPLPLGDTTAPCNNSADCRNDQVPVNERASSEAPLSASPDSGNGNVPDETAKSSFVVIVDDRSCKSGKSGDVAQAKRPYGEFRHVLLTDAEGYKLRDLYKEDLKLAIDILDSYIETGGKAAKKYKSHALVMRKGNWVWQKVQETKLTEKRLENANRKTVNFKAEERERTARMLRGEDMDGKNYVRDEDLTPEELERKYG